MAANRIDEPTAVKLLQRYEVTTEDRAKKSVEFIKQYRSYVINYGLGEDMVRGYIEAAGATPEARWKAMERILSEPTDPSRLVRRAAADSEQVR